MEANKLAESEANVRQILNQLMSAVLILNSRFEVEAMNASVGAIFGAEIMGHHCKTLFKTDFQEDVFFNDALIASTLNRVGHAVCFGKDRNSFPVAIAMTEMTANDNSIFVLQVLNVESIDQNKLE